MKNKNDEITIKSLAEMFLPRIWLILLISVVLAALLAVCSHLFIKDTYTSSGKYMVVKIPSTSTNTVVGLNSQEILAMQSMIANAKEIINTKDFCDSVLEKIDDADLIELTVNYNADLADLTEARDSLSNDIDDITTKYLSQLKAYQNAEGDVSVAINNLTKEFNDRLAKLNADRATVDTRIEALTEEYNVKVAEINTKPEGYVPYSDYITSKMLMNMISISLSNSETTCYFLSVTCDDPELARDVALVAGTILTEKFVGTGYAVKIDRLQIPLQPTSPDSKNVIRNGLIGFVAGFMLTALVIFIYNRFDVVIRTREQLEGGFDYPILGVIPRLESDGSDK